MSDLLIQWIYKIELQVVVLLCRQVLVARFCIAP